MSFQVEGMVDVSLQKLGEFDITFIDTPEAVSVLKMC